MSLYSQKISFIIFTIAHGTKCLTAFKISYVCYKDYLSKYISNNVTNKYFYVCNYSKGKTGEKIGGSIANLVKV